MDETNQTNQFFCHLPNVVLDLPTASAPNSGSERQSMFAFQSSLVSDQHHQNGAPSPRMVNGDGQGVVRKFYKTNVVSHNQ